MASFFQTTCPLCHNTQSMVKPGRKSSRIRFDPMERLTGFSFIREVISIGRSNYSVAQKMGGGFKIISDITMEQAARDPRFREVVNNLHARISLLAAYLDEVNK